MTQPQNNITTFLISDPNGGQPQMIKVMGASKLPLQLATTVASPANASTIKTYFKTTSSQDQITPGTIIPASKVTGRQVIAVHSKAGVNLQGLSPVVVPVSGMQIKPARALEQQYAASIMTGRPTTTISSPMVIRTPTGQMAVATNSIQSCISSPIQLPQITVNKNLVQPSFITTPLLQANFKQNATLASVASNKLQPTFTLKAHPAIPGQKQPELFLVQQKPNQLASKQHILIQNPQVQQSSHSNGISPPKSLMNTSILDHSRKRHDFDFDYSIENKRRKTEKGSKGLRHFSMKVCEKVRAKGTTSYNEVADELVNEFSESNRSHTSAEGVSYDQKNIRRRVYDALNVLMAMNIITKEKKEIRWLGLPTNSLQECCRLEQEKKNRQQKIKLKTQQLLDLILQQIAFKNLVERNRRLERESGPPSHNSTIQLPFIIVNTSKKTIIDCSISNDKTEYLFNFDDTFEIHDDIEVLKRMGMAHGLEKGECSPSDLEKAKSLVPKALESYVVELANNHHEIFESKFEPSDENGILDDLDAIEGVEEYFFEKAKDSLRQGEGKGSEGLSRHSSLMSLTQEERTESASPSSFGEEYEEEEVEESDVEI